MATNLRPGPDQRRSIAVAMAAALLRCGHGLARIGAIGIPAVALDPESAGGDRPGRSLDSPSTDSRGAVERLRRHRWTLPGLTLAIPTDLAATAISGTTGGSGVSAACAFVALGLLTALGWCAARD